MALDIYSVFNIAFIPNGEEAFTDNVIPRETLILVVNLIFLFVLISFYFHAQYKKKQEEDALRYQRNLDEKDRILGDIVTSLREPAVIFSVNKSIIAANASFLSLFDKEEAKRYTREDEFVDEFIRGGHNSKRREIELKGRIYYVDYNKVGSNGNQAVLVYFTDISELIKVNRQQQDFISDLRHEIKTPLTAIIGLSNVMLENRVSAESEKSKILKTINSEAERINGLVDKLTSSLLNEVPFHKIAIKNIFEELSMIYASQNLSIPIHFDDQVNQYFYSNYQLLKQILINLINNGVKYTDEGEINVTAKIEDHEVRIYIQDTGVGIDDEEQQKIFDRFYRIDKSRHRETGGYGLGLSIVKTLTNQLGGKIDLKSKVGEGSTFILSLPLDLMGPSEKVSEDE